MRFYSKNPNLEHMAAGFGRKNRFIFIWSRFSNIFASGNFYNVEFSSQATFYKFETVSVAAWTGKSHHHDKTYNASMASYHNWDSFLKKERAAFLKRGFINLLLKKIDQNFSR